MAKWDMCKKEAQGNITKDLVNNQLTLKVALENASKETGIPVGTLKEWYYKDNKTGQEQRKSNDSNNLQKGLKNQTFGEPTEIIGKVISIPECIKNHEKSGLLEKKYLRAKDAGKKVLMEALTNPFKTVTELKKRLNVNHSTASDMIAWCKDNDVKTKCTKVEPWNGITDAIFSGKLMKIYGPKAILKGLPDNLSPIAKDNIESRLNPAYSQKPNAYLLNDTFNATDPRFEYRSVLVKFGYGENEKEIAHMDFEEFTNVFPHEVLPSVTKEQIVDWFEKGIRPPKLVDKECKIWDYQNPKNAYEYCGLNVATHAKSFLTKFGSCPGDSEIKKMKGADWLHVLVFIQKQFRICMFEEIKRSIEEGPMLYKKIRMVYEFAPESVIRKMNHILINLRSFTDKNERKPSSKTVNR